MTPNDNYLVFIQWADATKPDSPDTWSSEAKTFPDLWHSLLQLFYHPLDQFQPDTGRTLGLSQYIRQFSIINLADGVHEATSFIITDHSGGVFEELGMLLRGELLQKTTDVGATTRPLPGYPELNYLPLATPSEDGSYLVPSVPYCRLLPETMIQVRNPDFSLFVHSHLLSLKVTDLESELVAADKLAYRSFDREIYTYDLKEALYRLLELPSAAFDMGSAFQEQLHLYYEAAQLGANYNTVHPYAQTITIPPSIAVYNNDDEIISGRLFAFHPTLKELMSEIGFDKADIISFAEYGVVHLDQWDPGTGKLSPTAKFQEALEYVKSRQDSHPPKYKVIQTYGTDHLPADPERPQASVIEQQMEGDDLSALLFKLLMEPVNAHDMNQSARAQLPRSIIDARIVDSTGAPVVQYSLVTTPANHPEPGIYLAFTPEVLEQIKISGLNPEQLLHGSNNGWENLDNAIQVRVADYAQGKLQRTEGFAKFCTLLLARHLHAIFTLFPERRRIAETAQLPQANFYLRKQWQLDHPTGGKSETYSFFIPYSDPNDALLALSKLRPRDTQDEPWVIFSLVGGAVVDSTGQTLATLPKPPGSIGLADNLARDQIPPDFLVAWDAFTTSHARDDLKGPAQRPGKTDIPRPKKFLVVKPDKYPGKKK